MQGSRRGHPLLAIKTKLQKLNTELSVQGSQRGHPLLAIKAECTEAKIQN